MSFRKMIVGALLAGAAVCGLAATASAGEFAGVAVQQFAKLHLGRRLADGNLHSLA